MADAYDGATAEELLEQLRVPNISLHRTVASTMDIAHDLAAHGASAGSMVLADEQTAGRGREARRWISAAGQGIWLSLVERPLLPESLGVLSLRVGLHAAETLDRFAGGRVRLKWPNDLYVEGGKLAGVLVEARWRQGRPDWLVVGFGLNVSPPPGQPRAASLRASTSRLEVLRALVPALRAAALKRGGLTPDELAQYAARDAAAGRRCVQPVRGTVIGITPDGELAVREDGVASGSRTRTFRSGSLVLEESIS